MNNRVYVLHELDCKDNERIVIGVVDSPDKIEPLMNEYYGIYEVKVKAMVQEANVYSYYNITITNPGFTFGDKYYIWVESFTLNQP
jgi:hypothetical protein